MIIKNNSATSATFEDIHLIIKQKSLPFPTHFRSLDINPSTTKYNKCSGVYLLFNTFPIAFY